MGFGSFQHINAELRIVILAPSYNMTTALTCTFSRTVTLQRNVFHGLTYVTSIKVLQKAQI